MQSTAQTVSSHQQAFDNYNLQHALLKLSNVNTQQSANPTTAPMTSWVSHAKSNIGHAVGSRLRDGK